MKVGDWRIEVGLWQASSVGIGKHWKCPSHESESGYKDSFREVIQKAEVGHML